jgi:dolichol-phosphate mannosyltransferase
VHLNGADVTVGKTGIVLATYNELGSLSLLVERLEALGEDIRIHIIDDSSPDGTAAKAEELAQRYGNISVGIRPRKMGLGSALRRGIESALDYGCDYVVTMDADLSHDPEDVPRLLEALVSGGVDMAQGSRYVTGGGTIGWHWKRRLLSRLANLSYHYLLGTPAETTTSFRAYNRRCAQLVVNMCRGNGFEFQPESSLIAMSQGMKVREVPIVFTNRVSGKSKLGLGQTLGGGAFFLMALIMVRLRLGRFSRSSEPRKG